MALIIGIVGIVGLIVGVIGYILLPAITLHSVTFVILLLLVIGIIVGVIAKDSERGMQIMLVMAMVLLLMLLGSSPIFNARTYSDLLNDGKPLEVAKFEDYAGMLTNVPLMDKDTATQLASRKMGGLADVVSQYAVGDNTQITYKGASVRVAPIEYGGYFKWMRNKRSGTPGYIKINMYTQDVELVKVTDGIRYTRSGYFGDDILRYLRSQYMTALFGEVVFEIDDEGTPYWVASIEKTNIGLFGGRDVDRVVLVNAVTGETKDYAVADVPEWVDSVYSSSLLTNQYDYYGKYRDGYMNSIIGQKGVSVTTEGYNYIPIGNDNWLYTGITSRGLDESNIGFILVNKRTKEVKYYEVNGAEEYSAMTSAEGVVQHLGYNATFPLLLNVEGQPTYLVALKDTGGLVKMYALVNVEKYQIVATGETITEATKKYRSLLQADGTKVTEVVTTEVKGIIEDKREGVVEGMTHYYLKLNGSNEIYDLSIADNAEAVYLSIGDEVVLATEQGMGIIKSKLK